MKNLDRTRFGPWAVVTGASSGIGREFARQLAAHRVHVVLVARREALLREVGRELTARYEVQHRVVAVDLTEPDAVARIARATDDLDIGLVVSNAGSAMSGEFLSHDLDGLRTVAHLNVMANLDVAHHFGRRLVRRGRGGLILVSAANSSYGVPNMANAAATKAYVTSLGRALHAEFARAGVSVSVLLPGPTETPVLDELGFQRDSSPIKPMPVEQCVTEGLDAVAANRATLVPGRVNRIMDTVIPARVSAAITGRMIGRWLRPGTTQHANVTGEAR